MLHRLPLRFPDTRDQFRCAPILLFVQTIVALLLPCRPALAAPVAPVPVPGPVPATASVPADLDPATIDGRPGCLGITPGGGTALFLVETLRLPGGLELELRPVNPAGDELPELVSWRQMLASCESGEISPAALRRSCAQAVSAGLARTLPPLRERLRAARLRPCIQAEPPGHGLRIGRKIVRFAERHQPDGDVEITLDGVRLLQLPQGVVEQDPVEIKELPDPAPGPADTSAPGEALRSAPPPPAVEPVSMQESHLQGVYTGPVARSLFVAVRSLTLEPLADDPRTLVQATLTTTIRSFTWRQLRRVDCAPVAGRPAYPDLTTALEPVPEGYERSDEEYIGPQICQGLTPDGRAGWFLVGENESHLGETGDFVETSKWRHVLLGDRRQLPRGRPRRLVPCLETQPDRPFRVLDRRGRLEGSHVVLDDGEPTFVTELTYCEGPGDCGVKEHFERLYHLPGGPSLFFRIDGENTGYRSTRIASLTAEELGLAGCTPPGAAIGPDSPSPSGEAAPWVDLEQRGGLLVFTRTGKAEVEVRRSPPSPSAREHGPRTGRRRALPEDRAAHLGDEFFDRRGEPWFRHGLRPGSYLVRVSQTGHLPLGREVEVRPWETTKLYLELPSEPSRSGPPEKAGIRWIALHGGTFEMGHPGSGGQRPADEAPLHRVSIAPFAIMQTETTQAMYRLCVQAGACTAPRVDGETCPAPASASSAGTESQPPAATAPSGGKLSGGGDQPVVCVDWSQARSFARWVGRRARLCSEAEWEYAARSAGRSQAYPWGNAPPDCRRVVMNEQSAGCGRGESWPVCSKPDGHSSQGVCDLAGNVAEWVEDVYHPSYAGAPGDGSPWAGPPGARRVVRGSSFESGGPTDEPGGEVDDHRVTRRFAAPRGQFGATQGFRLCRSLAP